MVLLKTILDRWVDPEFKDEWDITTSRKVVVGTGTDDDVAINLEDNGEMVNNASIREKEEEFHEEEVVVKMEDNREMVNNLRSEEKEEVIVFEMENNRVEMEDNREMLIDNCKSIRKEERVTVDVEMEEFQPLMEKK